MSSNKCLRPLSTSERVRNHRQHRLEQQAQLLQSQPTRAQLQQSEFIVTLTSLEEAAVSFDYFVSLSDTYPAPSSESFVLNIPQTISNLPTQQAQSHLSSSVPPLFNAPPSTERHPVSDPSPPAPSSVIDTFVDTLLLLLSTNSTPLTPCEPILAFAASLSLSNSCYPLSDNDLYILSRSYSQDTHLNTLDIDSD